MMVDTCIRSVPPLHLLITFPGQRKGTFKYLTNALAIMSPFFLTLFLRTLYQWFYGLFFRALQDAAAVPRSLMESI